MTTADRIKEDLDYVANTVRHHDRPSGLPAIYFLWAAITAIGFALPDFAPRAAGPFWMVSGVGGGMLSWWIGARESRRRGINDVALGQRYGWHWIIAGIGFLLVAVPVVAGRAQIESIAGNFLLVGGLVYALAGVHLDRPMLWSGLLMLAGYLVLNVFALPYTWTITGAVIGLSLLLAGLSSRNRTIAAAR